VKHGVAPRADGGDITIAARIEAGIPRCLSICVRDTGAGASAEALRRGRERGVGLRNVERRLRGQYGPAASLLIDSAPGTGTLVELRIPITATPVEEHDSWVAV